MWSVYSASTRLAPGHGIAGVEEVLIVAPVVTAVGSLQTEGEERISQWLHALSEGRGPFGGSRGGDALLAKDGSSCPCCVKRKTDDGLE